MNKLKAAYQNEMIKAKHKTSVWVIGIMMLAIVVVILGGIKITASISDIDMIVNDYDDYIQHQTRMIEEIEREIQAEIKNGASNEDLIWLYERKIGMERSRNEYQLLKEYDVRNTYSYSYKYSCVEEICESKYSISMAELLKTVKNDGMTDKEFEEYIAEYDKEIARCNKKVEVYTKILAESDFKGYIETKIREVDEDELLSEDEKRLEREKLNLRLEGNITGEYASHQEYIQIINDTIAYRISIETGYDYVRLNDGYGAIPLFPSQIKDYKEKLAVAEYKLKSGYYNINEGSDFNSFMSTIDISKIAISSGMSLLIILMVMLAGGTVSNEVSSGSVKSLIFAPVKRWKIFVAKLMMLMTIGIMMCIALSLFTVLITGLFFGFNNLVPYVYYAAGAARSMPYALYVFVYVLVSFLPIIFYMLLAYMMSALTRNTALSIGLTLGIYYISGTAITILSIFVSNVWLKYIPMTCMNAFKELILPELLSYNDIMGVIVNVGNTTGISVGFALIYFAAFIFGMLFTARDSFCKRDIK